MVATRRRVACPGCARGLGKAGGKAHEAGTHGQEHERGIGQSEKDDDAGRGKQGMADARLQGEAECAKQGARRRKGLHPGKGRDLRRDHERQHEAEDPGGAGAHVCERGQQRGKRAKHHGDHGRQGGDLKRVECRGENPALQQKIGKAVEVDETGRSKPGDRQTNKRCKRQCRDEDQQEDEHAPLR